MHSVDFNRCKYGYVLLIRALYAAGLLKYSFGVTTDDESTAPAE